MNFLLAADCQPKNHRLYKGIKKLTGGFDGDFFGEFTAIFAFNDDVGKDVTHLYGSAPYFFVRIATTGLKAQQVIDNNREHPRFVLANLDNQGAYPEQFVVRRQTFAVGNLDQFRFQLAQETFYAGIENVSLVVELKIQDGPRNATAFCNFLKSGVFVALDFKNFQRLIQDLVFSLFVLDRNRHVRLHTTQAHKPV